MVIRPKSMATVVSVLRERVSSVMPFSVDNTVISLIVRMRVVLPAENGPVTTIFTALPPPRRRFLPGVVAMSEPPYAGDEAQQQALVHARVALDEAARRRLRCNCGSAINLTDDRRHTATSAEGGEVLVGVVRRAARDERLRAGRDHLGRVVLDDLGCGLGPA